MKAYGDIIDVVDEDNLKFDDPETKDFTLTLKCGDKEVVRKYSFLVDANDEDGEVLINLAGEGISDSLDDIIREII